jgi:site-specific DNA recombinase
MTRRSPCSRGKKVPADLVAAPVLSIGYIRVSMKREEMISPETQRAAIEHLAARTGRKIIDWVVDLDKTGRNFKRKITKAIDRVKAGEADEIIVWKFSRFGRDRYGNAVYLAELENAGGRLVSATEEVDADTATGRFQRGVLLEVSAFESDRAGETWAETYDYRVREGLPPLGRPRFGYKRLGRIPDEDDPQRTRHVKGEKERYAPDEDSGKLALASAYHAYVAGDGFTLIARKLSADGWRTAYGNQFRAQAVRDMLDSGFGAGYLLLHDPDCRCKDKARCRRKRYVRGSHEPVILEETWQAYLERRARVQDTPRRARTPVYPVSALVRCGHCRGAIVPSGYGEGGAAVFTCSRHRHYRDCPGRPSLPVTRIVEAAREVLARWAQDLDEMARAEAARTHERHAAKGAIARLESELAKAEKELVGLARARAADDGVLPDEAWKRAAAEMRAERDRTAEDLRRAKAAQRVISADLLPVLVGVLDAWDHCSPAALNQELRYLIRRIVIYRTGERQRNRRGHWELMPVRIEIVPAWVPDPWETQ